MRNSHIYLTCRLNGNYNFQIPQNCFLSNLLHFSLKKEYNKTCLFNAAQLSINSPWIFMVKWQKCVCFSTHFGFSSMTQKEILMHTNHTRVSFCLQMILSRCECSPYLCNRPNLWTPIRLKMRITSPKITHFPNLLRKY